MNEQTKKVGVFAISPVSGLNYVTETTSGITDEAGRFFYTEGDSITFSIGNLVLGSCVAKEEVTPADMSFEADGNIHRIKNRKVTNVTRLLLSLNPKDNVELGITVTDEIRDIIEKYRYRIYLNQPESFFTEDENIQALMEELGSKLCSPAYARNCLRRRMNGIIKETDVHIPLRTGSYLCADIFRPVEEGNYPVVISCSGYGKAFWFGAIRNEEDFEAHEKLEDGYFSGQIEEIDYINFHQMLAGSPLIPADAPGFPKPGSPHNPMMSYVSEYFERANTLDWVPYGYVVINVDSACTGNSPGLSAQFGRPEAENYYDCIEWAAKQSWANGNVGIYGGSFYAMNAFTLSTLQPPSLKAMIPLCGDLDPYRDYSYTGGMLNKFGFVPKHCAGEWQGYDMVQYVTERPFDEPEDYNAHNMVGMKCDPDLIKVPFWSAISLEQGSIHTRGTSEAFIHTATPWEHKKLDVLSEIGVHYWMYRDDQITKHRKFFDYWLKGEDNNVMDTEMVNIMVRTGNGGYYWKKGHEWPLANTDYQKFYLQTVNGGEGQIHSMGRTIPEAAGKTTYSADVPVGQVPDSEFGVKFVTAPFEEDTTIIGYSKVNLYVSSTSHDMAVLAYLRVLDENDQIVPVVVDLNPTFPMAKGALKVSHRVQDPEKRTEYRPYHTHRKADYAPLTPGEVVDCEVELFPTTMEIKKGWKLMLEIQPNNMGEYVDPYDDYRAGSENSIYTGGDTLSYLQIPVIPKH